MDSPNSESLSSGQSFTDHSTPYKEALEWLFSRLPMFSRVGAPAYKPGLQTVERLDDMYGHPHRRFKAIHVAGTNGKGSSSHMIAAVLQACGYKTGLYTSPHLTDFRERIRVDGKMIPEDDVVRFVEDWKRICTGTDAPSPSFFELTMMMAFDWFARREVDYAVIEVGMGGRLDSTNIITPILSVITNISFDHTQFLGTTLAAIAGEKAGIIKPGVPVVIGEAEGEVRDVFLRKAVEERSPIVFAQDLALYFEQSNGGWLVSTGCGEPMFVPLAGAYQKKNIRTVVCALRQLRRIGLALTEQGIRNGLGNVGKLTGLRGRWQVVGERPVVICDTGHNLAGITETMASLRQRYPGRTVRFVVGFVNDKDVSHIVELFPDDGVYYFSQASIPRAMAAGDVARHFEARGIRGQVHATVPDAFKAAMSDASEEDVIYVGGSTFIVADFLNGEGAVHQETTQTIPRSLQSVQLGL